MTERMDFGRVGVLMGGWSAEREVSLVSGRAVLQALCARGVDAHGVDVTRDNVRVVIDGCFDRVFIALHGRGGEDGVMQGLLEAVGIPYTGSGVLASALAMDKLRTKRLWAGAGLPTPPFAVLSTDSDPDAVIAAIGLPMIVKPASEGSSLGMTRVDSRDSLQQAFDAARAFGDEVFAERWIQGDEYTAAILGERVLPLIRIETPRGFYDYEAKYHSDQTRYHCPAGLDAGREGELAALARTAFDVPGCSGWGRVDLICDEHRQPWLIEVNTVPGMTSHSLVPMASQAAGIDFAELVWRILAQTCATPHSGRAANGDA